MHCKLIFNRVCLADIEVEDAEPLLAWFDPEWKGYISYAGTRMSWAVCVVCVRVW